jgi:thiol-disulfide isomerase/thioredoxin
MSQTVPLRSIPRDLLTGFAAIVCVVGISVRAQFVGSDMRLLFAVNGVAFFFAGLFRGKFAPQNPFIKALIVSCPGLLGTAALIMNDGLHRVGIPVTISLSAILLTLAGTLVRRLGSSSPLVGVGISLLSACVLGAFSLFFVPRLVRHASSKQIFAQPPNYSVTLANGQTLESSDLHGKVVVVVFWATWCLPCLWELPEVDALSSEFRRDSRVTFLAVDANWEGESPEKARVFFARRKLATPWAFDNDGAAKSLDVDSLPTVVVLDQRGHIRLTHYGYDASEHIRDVLRHEISSLLAEGGQ